MSPRIGPSPTMTNFTSRPRLNQAGYCLDQDCLALLFNDPANVY